MKIKYIFPLLFTATLLNSQNLFTNLGGQRAGISAMNFLKLSTSARGEGMANTLLAISDDISSIQQNPSAAVIEEKNSIYFFHNKWFANISNQKISYLHHLSANDAIAISVTSLSTDDILKRTVTNPFGTGEYFSYSDLTLGLTYARALTDQFKFGMTVKLANEKLAELKSNAILFDFGARYFINYGSARFAFAYTNFGSTIKPNGEVEVNGLGKINQFNEFLPPTNFSLGFAFDPIDDGENKLISSIQLNHPNDNVENLAIGFEYIWSKMIALRMGKKINVKEQNSFSFGFGIAKNIINSNINIDYAIAPFKDLGLSHSISILSKF